MPPKHWVIDVLIWSFIILVWDRSDRFFIIFRCISVNHIMHSYITFTVPWCTFIIYLFTNDWCAAYPKQPWHTRPPGWHGGLLPSPDKRSASRLVGKWPTGHDETTELPLENETCGFFSQWLKTAVFFRRILAKSKETTDFRLIFSSLDSCGLIASDHVT